MVILVRRFLFILSVFVCASISFFINEAHAIHRDLENESYLHPSLAALGVMTGTYVISEMEEGPAVFAGLYAMGSLYLMREKYRESEEFADLVVPFSLIALAVVNAALLSDDDDFDEHEVFLYNLGGIGLITAYAIWEHAHMTPGQRRREREQDGYSWQPWLTPNSSGFLLSRSF